MAKSFFTLTTGQAGWKGGKREEKEEDTYIERKKGKNVPLNVPKWSKNYFFL